MPACLIFNFANWNLIIMILNRKNVLNELLTRGIEAYLAIPDFAGTDYDITVAVNKNCVIRLQIRGTTLENKSTNNSVDVNGSYDFLIVVVVDNGINRFFILSNSEVTTAKGVNVKLSISLGNKVLDSIVQHENTWNKIKNFPCKDV